MLQVRNRITLEDFSLLSLIGRGSYGKVVLVKSNLTGIPYALKILKKAQVAQKKQEQSVLLERKILSQVDHPFIVKMLGSFQSPKSCGDLYGLITKRHRFTEDQTRFYSAQVILALEHLHSKNIVYRDLKPENILIDKAGYIRLTDFGLSSITQELMQTTFMPGTLQYLAPEILEKEPHGRAVDLWCLGNLIYEMVTGIPAFSGNNQEATIQKIKTQAPIFPPKTSSRLRSLLESLLHKDPAKDSVPKESRKLRSILGFPRQIGNVYRKKEVKAPFVPLIDEEYDISNFDQEFTAQEVNSWDERKSINEEQWDLSDFSCEQGEQEEIDSDSFQGCSFEMKTEEETNVEL